MLDSSKAQWFPGTNTTAVTAVVSGKSGRLNLKVPVSLHENLAALAKRERVSLNFMVGVLLAEGIERHA